MEFFEKKEIYCSICGRFINSTPIIGEKYFRFKDGYYCQKCAKITVDKRRRRDIK